MGRKINAGNVRILTLSGTILGAACGAIGTYPLHIFYPYAQVNVWLNISLILTPLYGGLAYAAIDSLRHELGWRSPVKIISNSFDRPRRKIPFSSNEKDGNIFMFSIPWIKPSTEKQELKLESFTVQIDDIDYTISLSDMESFIRSAWYRQRNGKNGLSRNYWTRQHRPRLKILEYYIRMNVLSSVPGLILDRGQGRSGRLANSPLLTIKTLV